MSARQEQAGGATVVLLSGGLDSSVLLAEVARERGGANVHALSFRYGQRHARELEAAARQAAAAGVASHRVLDLTGFGDLVAAGTCLTEGGAAVPALAAIPEQGRDQPPTYVPNRNMVLLAVAAAYAEALGASTVWYGAQAQDEYGYWDCTAEFLERVNAVLALNRRTPVEVRAPFVRLRKADLVRRGAAWGVDFGQTWTCYRGGAVPCGECPSCVERARAFAEAGAVDPLTGGRPA